MTSTSILQKRTSMVQYSRVGTSGAICPLTEAGYIRLATNPAVRIGSGSFATCDRMCLRDLPGDFLATVIGRSRIAGLSLTAPFAARIFGHQQVTDAYLLGLAIKENGVLVTFDRGIRYLAGAEFSENLLVLG